MDTYISIFQFTKIVFFFFVIFMQVIAEVVEASMKDYEDGMRACYEASKTWMQVSV